MKEVFVIVDECTCENYLVATDRNDVAKEIVLNSYKDRDILDVLVYSYGVMNCNIVSDMYNKLK